MLDEVGDAVGVAVGDLAGPLRRLAVDRVVLVDDLLDALVPQDDGQPLVEEGVLLDPAADRLEVVVGGLEDRLVGPEGHRGAGALRRPALLQRAAASGSRRAGSTGSRRADAHLEPGGQRVDDRDADAVQPAGDGVGLAVELPAGVQHGQDDLEGRPLLRRVHVDRDAAAVVVDPHAAVGQQRHLDAVGVAGERLVDGVVDDLPHQVVQPALGGRADVHAGALADRLEPLEDGDGAAGVAVLTGAGPAVARWCCRGLRGAAGHGPTLLAARRSLECPASYWRRRCVDRLARSPRMKPGRARPASARRPGPDRADRVAAPRRADHTYPDDFVSSLAHRADRSRRDAG